MSNLNILNEWREVRGYFTRRSAQSYMGANQFAFAASGCGSSCGSDDGKPQPSACGTGDNDKQSSPTPASACGAGDDQQQKPSSCGSGCGAGDDK